MATELSVDQRFSLSEFESLANTFSPSVMDSDVFSFEPNEALVMDQSQPLETNISHALNDDTMILLEGMDFAPEATPIASSADVSNHTVSSHDLEAGPQVSPQPSVSSHATTPPQSEDDSGHASDESSTYDPSNAASMDASLDIDMELKVPRAHKRELQARPFAKRSKANFYEDMTEEEKRLIEHEGFKFPNRQLTKTEEKQLKKLRRKVKNKISAQDSRKRRKEYVTKLEGNIKQAAAVNTTLKTRVTSLEKQNQTLLEQLRQLQATLQQKMSGNAASAGTALMLLGLCFSMFVSPDAVNGSLPTSLPGFDTINTPASATTFTSRTLKSVPDVSATSWKASDTASVDARQRDDIMLDPEIAAQLNDILATINSDGIDFDLDDNSTGLEDDDVNGSLVPEPATESSRHLNEQLMAMVDSVSVQA
eukprot:TRINITY_DN9278_c0_g1_i1.p2 TRINITY_DN9278_c0_g1~~TRINITY_DN9278_c0_g1_i1.p2  ORF type:complete len:424 (+),score=124.92 TRINITY_DN9278_c0_g1_i1:2945-4216(+)